MFEALRTALLRWMLVPAEPHPPAGSPGSLQVFRAGRNLYMLQLLKWALGQCATFVTLALLLTILHVAEARSRTPWPDWLSVALYIVTILAIAIYLLQLPLTYAALRLNFDMRWYMVTDRSLRIRAGIWSVKELTMTFANIQQVKLTQGPLQRILGIADLVVTSAGGTATQTQHGTVYSAHGGSFEGVDNAEAIRDLILDRLRLYRDAGLGDPDDQAVTAPSSAAQEVLAEVRHLRAILTPDS